MTTSKQTLHYVVTQGCSCITDVSIVEFYLLKAFKFRSDQ